MYQAKLKQTATYWAPNGADASGGISFSAPVSLICRWENKNVEIPKPTEETVVSKAVVWLNQEVEIGGYLLLGTSIETNPLTVAGADEIQGYSEIPNLRNMEQERKAYL